MTEEEWPSSVCSAVPVAASQSRTVLSSEPETTCLPSGEKATDQTRSEWPSSVCSGVPGDQDSLAYLCQAEDMDPSSAQMNRVGERRLEPVGVEIVPNLTSATRNVVDAVYSLASKGFFMEANWSAT